MAGSEVRSFEGRGVGGYTVSVVVDSIGVALASGGPNGAVYPVFHSEGREISDVGFTFSGSDDYDSRMEYQLFHPSSAKGDERILSRGVIETIQEDVQQVAPSSGGTLDYLRPVHLKLTAVIQGANLSSLTSLLFTMSVKDYGGEYPAYA